LKYLKSNEAQKNNGSTTPHQHEAMYGTTLPGRLLGTPGNEGLLARVAQRLFAVIAGAQETIPDLLVRVRLRPPPAPLRGPPRGVGATRRVAGSGLCNPPS